MDYYLQLLLEGVKEHPYWTILAISVLEGRYTSIAVGALMAKGYDINPVVAYVIFTGMCIAGDMVFYYAGRTGHSILKFLIKKSWWDKINRFSDGKMMGTLLFLLITGKIAGGSKPFIIASGMAKMKLATFCWATVPYSIGSYIVTIAIGYFFGQFIF